MLAGTFGSWTEVAALAVRQGVASLLQRGLATGGALARMPDSVLKSLADERRATALENLRYYGEFRRIARALSGQGITSIALKGLHLSELVYRDISLRPMCDMDILVRHRDLECTVALLQDMGYGRGEDISGTAATMIGTKCNVGLRHRSSGIWLEVHWDIAEASKQYVPPVDDIWSSAVPARLGDADTLVMSPEFLLLHVCAHLALNHTFLFSLRGLCDIAEIVHAHPGLDWALLVQHGRQHGWQRGVTLALRLAKDHLGARVPADALATLGGDELDTPLLADAVAQMFEVSQIPGELLTAPGLLAMGGSQGLTAKAAAVWKRVFVPPEELSIIYGIPARSGRLPFYYAVRVRDLARKYVASGWALNFSDARLQQTAARHARLARWLAGSGKPHLGTEGDPTVAAGRVARRPEAAPRSCRK